MDCVRGAPGTSGDCSQGPLGQIPCTAGRSWVGVVRLVFNEKKKAGLTTHADTALAAASSGLHNIGLDGARHCSG